MFSKNYLDVSMTIQWFFLHFYAIHSVLSYIWETPVKQVFKLASNSGCLFFIQLESLWEVKLNPDLSQILQI